jgi:hypothetical protein
MPARLASALAPAMALLLLLGAGSAQAASNDGAYRQAVERTLIVLRADDGDDEAVAGRALTTLRRGVHDQPEIEADLSARPPRLEDAETRLARLATTLRSPARTSRPNTADATLRSILAQPRYAGLQPTLLERLRDWALARLRDALTALVGTSGGWAAVLRVVLAVVAAAVLATAVVLLGRALWRSPRRGVGRAPSAVLRERAGRRFADADRLAAAGDLAAALRMLTSAVAAALGDERDWDVSPLTVRELLARAPEPGALQPLVVAFERSAYGAIAPDAVTYQRAAAAAARLRETAGAGR